MKTQKKMKIENKKMRETRLDKLDSRIRPLAEALIENARAAGIALRVINTLRTTEEHQLDLFNGVSWTNNSLHLPQPPDGLSLAIDVCPLVYVTMKNWNPSGPYWLEIGEMGEALGLRWGGRWKQRDLGHFELRVPASKPIT